MRSQALAYQASGRLLTILAALFSMFIVAAPVRPLRLHLDWFPDAEFAGVFVAIQKGWYKQEGIELELVPAGFDVMPKLEPGRAEIGIHSGQDLIRYIGNGEPLR